MEEKKKKKKKEEQVRLPADRRLISLTRRCYSAADTVPPD
jgi:hypothetical protein